MSNNYKPFFGVVEDIFDPEKRGRVRVRVHDVHSPYGDVLPTSELNWSNVFIPAGYSATMSGIGKSSVSLLQGSLVSGYFVDGEDQSEFAVLWSIGGIPETHSGDTSNNILFKDPSGTFPLEYNTPDFNKLARGDKKKTSLEDRDKDNIVEDIYTADGSWSEPTSRYDAKYPWNDVEESVAGHLIEIDNTPDAERINIQHKSLSYMTFHKDGSIAIKDYNTRFDISKKRRIYTDGNFYSTVTGNRLDSIKNTWKIAASSFQVSANSKIFGDLDVTDEIKADKGHFNTIEATYAKTLAEVAVCAKALCPYGTTTASGVSVSVNGKVLIDTLSEAYELAATGISNAAKADSKASEADVKASGAIEEAKLATTTAGNASIAANTAITTANTAQTTSLNAIEAANNAENNSMSAIESAEIAVAQSARTTEYVGNLHNSVDTPENPLENDLWTNAGDMKIFVSGEWQDSNIRFSLDIVAESSFPELSAFIIQSGSSPDVIDEEISNIYLDALSSELYEWTVDKWTKVSDSIAEVITIANTVSDIAGNTPLEIVQSIESNHIDNLNILDSLSVAKGVMDGSIAFINSITEPLSANISDIWINGSMIYEYTEIGAEEFEWVLAENSDKLYSLIKTYVNLNEFKESTVEWFFQDVAPSNMKLGDMWYNNVTFEISSYTGLEWIANKNPAELITGTLKDVGISIASELKGALDITESSIVMQAKDINDSLNNVISMYYDTGDLLKENLMEIGSSLIDRNSLLITAKEGFKALDIVGNSLVNGNFNIIGDTTISGNMEISGISVENLSITTEAQVSSIIVSENSSFKEGLDAKDITITNIANIETLNVDGNTRLTGDLIVNGSSLLDSLEITNDAEFKNDVVIHSDLTIKNNLNIEGELNLLSETLTVQGSSNLESLEISNDATIGGDLDVLSNLTIDQDLNVTGLTSLKLVEMDEISIDNSLSVLGDTTLKNATIDILDVSGTSTLDTINSKNIEISEDIIVSGELKVSSNSTLNNISVRNIDASNNVGILGTLEVSNDSTFNDISARNIDVTNDISVDGGLSVSNDSIFNDISVRNIDISGDLSIEGGGSFKYIELDNFTASSQPHPSININRLILIDGVLSVSNGSTWSSV